MFTRFKKFLLNSGEVIVTPDDFFYFHSQKRSFGGILSLIFYVALLSLLIGITTNKLSLTFILMCASVVSLLILKFIHAIIIYVIAKLLGGTGTFINTYNFICYPYVLDFFLILGVAFLFLGKSFIIPLIFLISIWKIILTVLAVSNEHDLGYIRSFLASYVIILVITIIVGLLL